MKNYNNYIFFMKKIFFYFSVIWILFIAVITPVHITHNNACSDSVGDISTHYQSQYNNSSDTKGNHDNGIYCTHFNQYVSVNTQAIKINPYVDIQKKYYSNPYLSLLYSLTYPVQKPPQYIL